MVLASDKQCGYTIENGTEGTIISPNFNDGFYNNSLDCLYEIKVSPGFVIEVIFIYWRINSPNIKFEL